MIELYSLHVNSYKKKQNKYKQMSKHHKENEWLIYHIVGLNEGYLQFGFVIPRIDKMKSLNGRVKWNGNSNIRHYMNNK